MIIRFEWNPDKGKANLRKHGVSFEEATTVFGDPLASTFADPAHSLGEERLVTFGMSNDRRVLAVMHVEYAEGDGENRVRIIRVISARQATRVEREAYEEER